MIRTDCPTEQHFVTYFLMPAFGVTGMKCPYCGNLATDTDRVCYICKHYIGRSRQTERIGGETNYARLLPMVFLVIGVPAFLFVYQRYMPNAARIPTMSFERICLLAFAGLMLSAVGWVCGRLLGDGTTVRV
jgi:hypothetical protein